MSSNPSDYSIPDAIASHPAWSRLEDQRRYYSERAGACHTGYKRIKLALIALSAAIPIIAFMPSVDVSRFAVALAGVAIALLEGLLLLNEYGPLWVKYRALAEGLKRERWLLLSGAGDYKSLATADAMRLLAERVEAQLDEEHRAWSELQQKALQALVNANAQALAQPALPSAPAKPD